MQKKQKSPDKDWKTFSNWERTYKSKNLKELTIDIKYLAEIRDLFLHPDVTPDYELKWRKPDAPAITNFLCEWHDFSRERVSKAVERLLEASDKGQKTLDKWF